MQLETATLFEELCATRRMGYAMLDRALVAEDVGGCTDLLGGGRGADIGALVPELEGLSEAVKASVEAHESHTFSLVNRVVDGATRYVDITITPRSAGGRSILWVVDVTAQIWAAASCARAMVTIMCRRPASLGGDGTPSTGL